MISLPMQKCSLICGRPLVIVSQKLYSKVKHFIGKYPKRSFLTTFYNWLILNPHYSLSECYKLQQIDFFWA